MRTVFIYALREPGGGAVRYVGRSLNLRQRLAAHVSDARHGSRPLHAWLRSVDGKPMVTILERVAPGDPDARERHWISTYRKEGVLLNLNGVVSRKKMTRTRKVRAMCDPELLDALDEFRAEMARLGLKVEESRALVAMARRGAGLTDDKVPQTRRKAG